MAGVTDLINAINFQEQNRRDTSPWARIGELLQQELNIRQQAQAQSEKLAKEEELRNQRRQEFFDLISRDDLPRGLQVSSDSQGRITYNWGRDNPAHQNALYKNAWAIASDMAGEDADVIQKISKMPEAVKVMRGEFDSAPVVEEDPGFGDMRIDSIPIPPSAGVGPYLKNIKKSAATATPGGKEAPSNGMRAVVMPDGRTWNIPKKNVAEALKRGGKIAR